jgi:hypothetical protein
MRNTSPNNRNTPDAGPRARGLDEPIFQYLENGFTELKENESGLRFAEFRIEWIELLCAADAPQHNGSFGAPGPSSQNTGQNAVKTRYLILNRPGVDDCPLQKARSLNDLKIRLSSRHSAPCLKRQRKELSK